MYIEDLEAAAKAAEFLARLLKTMEAMENGSFDDISFVFSGCRYKLFEFVAKDATRVALLALLVNELRKVDTELGRLGVNLSTKLT